MTYQKETCKFCKGLGFTQTICTKCLGNGYIMVSERQEPKILINNKPPGTSARDGWNYGL